MHLYIILQVEYNDTIIQQQQQQKKKILLSLCQVYKLL